METNASVNKNQTVREYLKQTRAEKNKSNHIVGSDYPIESISVSE